MKSDHDMKNNHFGSLSIGLLALKQSPSLLKLAKTGQNRVLKITLFLSFYSLQKFDRQLKCKRDCTIFDLTNGLLTLFTEKY